MLNLNFYNFYNSRMKKKIETLNGSPSVNKLNFTQNFELKSCTFDSGFNLKSVADRKLEK